VAPTSWKVEYLHAGRRLSVGSPGPVSASARPPAGAERIGAGSMKYDFVRGYLQGAAFAHASQVVGALDEHGLVLAPEQRSVLAGFGARLAQLTDKLLWLGVRQAGSTARCLFARRAGRGPREVELSELSDSERMLVLLAATTEALGLSRSLVLIDAPELGLHPEDQARMFEGLQSMMFEGQLIAVTTSPAILRSVPADQVVVLQGS
jgi:hypothetical protein